MVSVCLPSDAILLRRLSYLGFSYLGRGVSLHGCSSKAQPMLLTLGEGYLLAAAPPNLECGIAPLVPLAPVQQLLLGRGVAPPGCCSWPQAWVSSSRPPPLTLTWGSSSWPPPLTSDLGSSFWPFLHHRSLELLAAAPDLERGVAPLGPPAPLQLPLFGHGVAPFGCLP